MATPNRCESVVGTPQRIRYTTTYSLHHNVFVTPQRIRYTTTYSYHKQRRSPDLRNLRSPFIHKWRFLL
ncbi:hypothetical protein PN465_10980 [Nodularia spumigena CS-584]|jgi:hypothetical protein|uniref:hypothetical protein n=1 Tax=Nodularia spumigena TaxID=70799 RepID=UPI0011848A8A|nr:hypothetical protein [Nodularia spumigena]MDB9382741.1 hypothetical protein [Nodularia spumigena CS-584]